MTAEQGSPTTEAGRALHQRIFGPSDIMPAGPELDRLILAVEAEARQQALTDADRLIDRDAVIDTLTRLRDGS